MYLWIMVLSSSGGCLLSGKGDVFIILHYVLTVLRSRQSFRMRQHAVYDVLADLPGGSMDDEIPSESCPECPSFKIPRVSHGFR